MKELKDLQEAKEVKGTLFPLFLLIHLFLLSSCSADVSNDHKRILLEGPERVRFPVLVEIADTYEERQQGLMNRDYLEMGKGMLFVFDQQKSLSFWMKNTLIPLDIIFFNSRGEFVSWQSMVPCEADPCRSYLSDGPARYALEVPAGYVRDRMIGIGWKLRRE